MNLSIIIPVLNEELFLPVILKCLSNQNFKDFEILVVDGQSTDNTLDVADSFKNKLNLKIINAPHKGVSLQRNLGADNATSDTLLFLDADTSFDNSFLEKVLTEFDKTKYEIGTVKCLPDDKNKLDMIINNLYSFYQNITKNFAPEIYGWMMLVKKTTHLKIKGFDEEISFSEDSDYVKRVVKSGGKFQILKTTFICSSTRRIKKQGRFSYESKMFKYFFYFKLYGMKNAQKKIKYD